MRKKMQCVDEKLVENTEHERRNFTSITDILSLNVNQKIASQNA